MSEAATRHSIWGRVEDADGEPPPRAIVYWIAGGHKGPALPLDLHPAAATDRAGHFYARDLPAGDGILIADCQAYGSGIVGARSSQGLSITLPLPAGEKDVVLRYPLSRKSFLQIRGVIVAGEDRRPLRGHRVVLLDPETSGRKFRQETDTDRGGEFQFAWVPPGKYSIGIPGTLSRLDDGYNIQNALPAGVDIPLEIGVAKRPPGGPRHSAVVRCVDETGAPVAGAEVAFRAMNFHSLPILAGEDGVARAEGFPVPLIGAMATKDGYLTHADALPPAGSGPPKAGPMLTGPLEPGAMLTGPLVPGPLEYGAPTSGPSKSEPPEVVFVLRRLVTVRVVAVDDGSGKPLPRARVAAEHAGGVAENIDTLLKPPKSIPADGGFDLPVVPGPVTFRAAYPGYEVGEARADVLFGEPCGTITVRLKLKGSAA